MLTLLRKNRGQNTAEYAILIALVIGAAVAMQTYAKRTLQGRVRDVNRGMVDSTNAYFGTVTQYEPYYKNDITDTNRTSNERTTQLGSNSDTVTKFGASNETAIYNASGDLESVN